MDNPTEVHDQTDVGVPLDITDESSKNFRLTGKEYFEKYLSENGKEPLLAEQSDLRWGSQPSWMLPPNALKATAMHVKESDYTCESTYSGDTLVGCH